MNRKLLTLACSALIASVSLAFCQNSFDLQRSLDEQAKVLRDYLAARTKIAQDQLARQQLLQDQAAQRAFLGHQAELQREHELRLEELRKSSSQENLSDSKLQKIEKEAYEKARKDLEGEMLAERRKQASALVPKAVGQFAAYLTSSSLKLPSGSAAFNSEAVNMVQTDFDAAEKKYPVDAPVIKAHLDAARALIEISKGLREFNESNTTDLWLAKFCTEQEETVRRGPEEQRIIDGKMFLPLAAYSETVRTNSRAANNFWTFSDIELLDRLAIDTHTAAKQKLAHLEAAGFVQKSESSKKPTPEK